MSLQKVFGSMKKDESHRAHRDGPWDFGVPQSCAGRWRDMSDVGDWKIQRVFIQRDYASEDTRGFPGLLVRSSASRSI